MPGQRLAISGLPPVPPELNTNAFLRPKAKFAISARYKALVLGVLQEAIGLELPEPLFTNAAVECQFLFPDRIRRDPSNLGAMFKAGLDALVLAGVLRDDGPPYVPFVANAWRYVPGMVPSITVVITARGDESWWQHV